MWLLCALIERSAFFQVFVGEEPWIFWGEGKLL